MENQAYQYILPKYYDGSVRWDDVAAKFNLGSGEAARSQFKRERKKRGDPPRQEGKLPPNNGIPNDDGAERTSYTEDDDGLHVVCDSERIKTKEDVINFFHINTDEWKIKEFTIRTSEGYRKDRKVQWKVVDGKVEQGDVDDSGKMIVVTLYHTETKLVRKTAEDFWTPENVDKLFDGLKTKNVVPVKVSPSWYARNGKALIVPIADMHYGLLATAKTNGNEYNMRLAEDLLYSTISQIKERVAGRKFEEIVFVIGNDFLNSDNIQGTTTRGTPQDNETFWYEFFDKAIELLVTGINSLLEISKVRVYNVISNHDHHSMYAMMRVLEAAFAGNKNVTFEVSTQPRQFYTFGKTVVGLTHDMKIAQGLELMTTEAKAKWTESKHFVWLLAHLHTEMQYERKGLVEMYRLPTFSGYSRWSNGQGFVTLEHKTQCFVLDAECGVSDTMYVHVG